MSEWQSIETVPKKQLVDIWIDSGSGNGVRWCDCYYDSICDQWRTSSPGGKLVWVPASVVTHWMQKPGPPK